MSPAYRDKPLESDFDRCARLEHELGDVREKATKAERGRCLRIVKLMRCEMQQKADSESLHSLDLARLHQYGANTADAIAVAITSGKSPLVTEGEKP